LDSPEVGVLVVDAQPIYRAAVARLCEQASELRLVGTLGTGSEALVEIPRAKPDVAIIDVDLPDVGGLAVLRALAVEAAPLTRMLVLTAEHDGAAVYRALASGATGYLAKRFVDQGTLKEAVVATAHGTTVVSPELMPLHRGGDSTPRVAE
jgi:two-component system nitrate/nitrite response regulator NarL